MVDRVDSETSPFLAACRRRATDRTPVWLMRQAGRYMREYRELRHKYGMLDIIKQPELSCQVTLQPIDAFAFDAAIIFADLLPPLEALGLKVGFEPDKGPVIYNPVRDEAAVHSLTLLDVEEATWFTLEAIRLACRELAGRGIPLIGFSGAPFTLACYAVEGGTSKDFSLAKRLLMERPDLWGSLMSKLSRLVTSYSRAQVRAGAQALQLFDTWAGLLSPADYRESVLPFNRAIVEELSREGVPVIYFSTGTAGMLELVGDCKAHVVGLDWRIDLHAAWQRLGPGVAVQGNLDPVALLADWPELRERAALVLAAAGGRPGHIFNLGHGVLPDTPVDNVRRLVEFVHQYHE